MDFVSLSRWCKNTERQANLIKRYARPLQRLRRATGTLRSKWRTLNSSQPSTVAGVTSFYLWLLHYKNPGCTVRTPQNVLVILNGPSDWNNVRATGKKN